MLSSLFSFSICSSCARENSSLRARGFALRERLRLWRSSELDSEELDELDDSSSEDWRRFRFFLAGALRLRFFFSRASIISR